MNLYLGVDIGGTKTAVAVLDREMNILARRSLVTKEYGNCRNLADAACRTAYELVGSLGYTAGEIVSCGVASPGPLDPESGRVICIPTLKWKDEPIVGYFIKDLPVPVALLKDTNAAVYYEALMGVAKGIKTVAYITVSTGIGSGLCIDGRLITGDSCLAGEIGHFPVIRNGRRCDCGSRGCLEAYASGTGISKTASSRLGRNVSAKEAFELARQYDPVASAVIARAGECIGYALAALCQMVDPGAIVFGGSVTKDSDILLPYIEMAIKKYTEPVGNRKTKILLSDTAGEQTLKGAALYGMKHSETSDAEL